jgi:hypothetical protein
MITSSFETATRFVESSLLRNGYEPLLAALADSLVIELPPWVPGRQEVLDADIQMPVSSA